jgi:hypothetical protein
MILIIIECMVLSSVVTESLTFCAIPSLYKSLHFAIFISSCVNLFLRLGCVYHGMFAVECSGGECLSYIFNNHLISV